MGPGTGPGSLGADVTLSWTGSGGDAFTETLTTIQSINRKRFADQIGLTLTGKVSDADKVFKDTPVLFILTANQAGGPGSITSSFTNTTSFTPSIPEPSTWVMMALGFGALGYAASRRRKANGALLSI